MPLPASLSASVLLGMYVHPYFLWFTLFVGLKLLQSGFTDWCPMIAFLRKLGVREAGGLTKAAATPARFN